ncbi:MAG: SMP-30/gluconolactonase/LRE family protein [Betaproteobacteria bacterium]|nr:SMP-30/gluconolactonase/LRE family protein [Betaproteobacteria bacterium]
MSLFPPPRELPTDIFARVPDMLRVRDRENDWSRANRPGKAVDCFLEGPSFDRHGNLWVTDIPYGRVFRVEPGGVFALVAEYDGWPNGLKIHRDGRIFITDYKRGLMLLDPKSGAVAPFLTHWRSESFKGVNDLVFASNGDLYFTDQGQTGLHDPTGRVFRLSAEGRLECLIDTVPSPNGLVLDLEESVLYVAVTRDNAVWRLPLMPDGGVSKVGAFLRLSGGTGPDGLALDADGNLYVCHVGMGSVWVFSPLGEPLYRIRSCAGLTTTNLAFGGAESRELYITESESGSILRATVPVPGRPMFSHLPAPLDAAR